MTRRAVKPSTVLATITFVILGIAAQVDAQMSAPIITNYVRAVAVLPGGNAVYVGIEEFETGGVLRINVDTGEVQAMNEGLTDLNLRSLVIDPSDPSRIYVASGEGIFRSEDGGRHWIGINQGISSGGINEIWVSSLNSDLLLAQGAVGSVYRTDDGGNQWRLLYRPRIDYADNLGTKLAATSDGSTIFAMKAGVPFRWSTDSGETWEDLSIVSRSSTFAFSSDDKICYAGQGVIGDERAVVVYRSLDEGDTWEGLEYGPPIDTEEYRLPQWGNTICLLPDPHAPGVIYAGTTQGVFYTTDGGVVWQPLGSQPLNFEEWNGFVFALALDRDRSRLYVGRPDGLFFVPMPEYPDPTAVEANSWGKIKSVFTEEVNDDY